MSNKIITNKYLTIFFTLLTLTFISGIYLGMEFNKNDLNTIELKAQQSSLDLKSISQRLELFNLLGEKVCDISILDSIAKDLFKMGRELEKQENLENTNSDNYNMLKQRYNVNQVLFYTQLKKFQNTCKQKKNIILFFFNSSSNSNLTSAQGKELDKLISKTNFYVLPMDYKYTKSLDYFYNFYSPKSFPYLVINYNKTFSGLTKSEDILIYLNNSN